MAETYPKKSPLHGLIKLHFEHLSYKLGVVLILDIGLLDCILVNQIFFRW
jgi:hypothetical protein